MRTLPRYLLLLGLLCAGCPAEPPAAKTPASPPPAATKTGVAKSSWAGLWRTSIPDAGTTFGLELSLSEEGGVVAGRLTALTPTQGDLVQYSSCALLQVEQKGSELSFVAPILTGAPISEALRFELERRDGRLEGRMRDDEAKPGSGKPVSFTRHSGKPARADGLTGAWRGSLTERGRPVTFDLALKDVDGQISGSLTFTNSSAPDTKDKSFPIVEGKRMGRELVFKVPISGKIDRDTLVFALTIRAKKLSGKTFENRKESTRLPVTIERKAD